MLGELEERSGRMVVADLEAGVGTISRLTAESVDRLLIVVEPYAKSLEVGRRARAVATEVGIGDLTVVVSRATAEGDTTRVTSALAGLPSFDLPEDPAVLEADRRGVAPIDLDPRSPAVEAAGRLADALLGQAAGLGA